MPKPSLPIILPFPNPDPAAVGRQVFKVWLEPCEFPRQVILECRGPDAAVEALKVRVFQFVG